MYENDKPIEKTFEAEREKSKIPVEDMEFKEPFETNEVKLQDGETIEGFYDGIYDRKLQEENIYTGLMTSKQIGMICAESEYKFLWASNGLLKQIQLQEVHEGDKIKIVRRGKGLNTEWGVIHKGT